MGRTATFGWGACRAGACVVVLLVATATLAWAAGGGGGGDEEEDVDFTPRAGTPPAKRGSAGSRPAASDPRGQLVIACLAPAETLGYTTRAQPAVYFVLSRDTDAPLEIGLTAFIEGEPSPVLETLIHEDGHEAGLVKVDLSQLKLGGGKPVRLEPGMRYEVAAVVAERTEGEGQSQNPSAACQIERLDPKQASVPKEVKATPRKSADWYARNGVWFDYLDALNGLIEKTPDDPRPLERRRKLLEPEGYRQGPDGSISLKKADPRLAPKERPPK